MQYKLPILSTIPFLCVTVLLVFQTLLIVSPMTFLGIWPQWYIGCNRTWINPCCNFLWGLCNSTQSTLANIDSCLVTQLVWMKGNILQFYCTLIQVFRIVKATSSKQITQKGLDRKIPQLQIYLLSMHIHLVHSDTHTWDLPIFCAQ